jgi:hypothetical protein
MKTICLALLLVLSLATWVSADAPLISVTGTIVSLDDEVLVVRTATGDLTFDLDKTTERPASLPLNSRITIWYDSDDKPEDQMDARRIVMAPAPAVPPAPAPAPAPEVRSEPVTPIEDEPEALPQTATALPLLGAAAFLSLAGGTLLKKLRRR